MTSAADFRSDEFESVALPHLEELYRFACRMMRDRNQAEDVLQEVYLQAWKSFHRFEKGTNCRAWLFKILYHCVHHHRRRWFNAKVVTHGEEEFDQLPAKPAPAAESLSDNEVLSALDAVPPDFRAVVLLTDVDEFSYKEVAGILGIPVGTVMSRLSRGRKQLREQLQGLARSYGIHTGKQKGQVA